jgi:hypothetical protein
MDGTNSIVELAARTAAGLEVALLWDERERRLTIVVADWRTGESFAIAAADGREALDAFYHPYAYADTSLRAAA